MINGKKEHEAESDMRWDETIDVIVIGSGFAGLSAAIEARNAGASVIVLEKMKAIGGNSTISDGGIAAPATDIQIKNGIEDSADLMAADMMKAGLGINDSQLVRIVADNARSAFEWSRQYLGVEYLDRVDQFGGHSVPRCYAAKNISGSTIIKRQINKVEEIGVTIRKGVIFDAFVQDSTGRLIGVKIRENYRYRNPESGNVKYINAEKGIVLATGGFAGDVSFRMSQDPRLTAEVDTTNKPSATAEALKAATNVGAAAMHLSHIQLGPWASPDEKGYGVGPFFSEYILFQYGIIIDPKTGDRFVNELADRKTLSDIILSKGHPCLGIADALAVKTSGWSIEQSLRRGVVKAFSSLGDFAEFYRISRDRLEKTIETFNCNFVQKIDRSFSKPIIEMACPIEHPPFYGMRLWPKVHYTMGGIKINPQGAVIGNDGEIIKGLFAAGEVTGGIHGACRLGSCSITECLVFGRIAGKNAAG